MSSVALSLCLSACGSGGDGRANYGLKVVLQPEDEEASAYCSAAGNSTGASGSARITGHAWVETEVDEDEDGTWYVVRLRSASDHVLGEWRHDEAMARQRTAIDDLVRDVRWYRVHIEGVFGSTDPCTPDGK